jgi:arylsulfatase A-like enzyme
VAIVHRNSRIATNRLLCYFYLKSISDGCRAAVGSDLSAHSINIHPGDCAAMKAVFVLFDSLNRKAMEPYGSTQVRTPNFTRLAQRAVTFDTHYVGGLPCMPARRDLHTGRPSFLHRNWGPLEPFDNSFPEILKHSGTYTHIVTDHYHYFDDGGGTYHSRYSTWELVRGNGIDHWKAEVEPETERYKREYHPSQITLYLLQRMVNRDYIREEEQFTCPQVFAHGLDFLAHNGSADNWLLQIESFDPHEPFFAPERFRKQYPRSYDGPILDWPIYGLVKETPEEIAEIRANYAALVAMCDEYLGRLLDVFDRDSLWKDTALILTTDHGFLLGEHDWWGKNLMPVYDELARIPLIIYHPDFADRGGERRDALTQTIDLMPTILEMFGKPVPPEVRGRSLLPVLRDNQKIRDTALYGYFGAACNITDGQHTYFRYPQSMSAENLYEYTLMPTRLHQRFPIAQLIGATLQPPFDFTKGVSTLRVRPQMNANKDVAAMATRSYLDTITALYDTANDPGQTKKLEAPGIEARLLRQMKTAFGEIDAPAEMYARYGLE